MNCTMIETSATKLLNYSYRTIVNVVVQHHLFIIANLWTCWQKKFIRIVTIFWSFHWKQNHRAVHGAPVNRFNTNYSADYQFAAKLILDRICKFTFYLRKSFDFRLENVVELSTVVNLCIEMNSHGFAPNISNFERKSKYDAIYLKYNRFNRFNL